MSVKLFVLSLTLLLAACASAPPKTSEQPPQASLYEQLGGAPAVAALVDALMAEYKSDALIAPRFDLPEAELGYVRERIIEQMCAATGGGCEYTGLPMNEAHSGMAISQAEFDAFMQATVRGMTKLGISQDHQQTLGSVLEGMRGEIVDQ